MAVSFGTVLYNAVAIDNIELLSAVGVILYTAEAAFYQEELAILSDGKNNDKEQVEIIATKEDMIKRKIKNLKINRNIATLMSICGFALSAGQIVDAIATEHTITKAGVIATSLIAGLTYAKATSSYQKIISRLK